MGLGLQCPFTSEAILPFYDIIPNVIQGRLFLITKVHLQDYCVMKCRFAFLYCSNLFNYSTDFSNRSANCSV